jgi:hypothetical protein
MDKVKKTLHIITHHHQNPLNFIYVEEVPTVQFLEVIGLAIKVTCNQDVAVHENVPHTIMLQCLPCCSTLQK